MTYINDNNFVHNVFYTIEKEVQNETIKNKLHDYFTKNVRKIDYDLFLLFSRAIGQLRRLYNNDNIKFSNTFILMLLTYLHEAKDIFPSNTDSVDVFMNRFFKKNPDSERVTLNFYGFDKFHCLYYLTLKLDFYIGTSNNIQDHNNQKNGKNDVNISNNNNNVNNDNSNGRRYRSRSRTNDSRSRRERNGNYRNYRNNVENNPSKRIWGSHLTEKQIAELEEQERVAVKKQQNPHVPPQTPPQPQNVHTNADEMISRLVRDNHSLYDAIRQRDATIINLQNEIQRLSRNIRNI